MYGTLLNAENRIAIWHKARYPQHRGIMHVQLPHNTAVIEELSSGDRYAVDAYFRANGKPPAIVPITAWMAGFTPDPRE